MDYVAATPAGILSIAALALYFSRPGCRVGFWISILSVAGALVTYMHLWSIGRFDHSGTFDGDPYSVFLSLLVVVLLAFALVLLTPEVTEKLLFPSHQAYLLFSTAIVLVMISTRDLLWVLVGLELLSVVTFGRNPTVSSHRSSIVFSALGSAMFFVGLGVLALVGGSTDIARIAAATVSPSLPITIGVVLVVIGVVFKWIGLSNRLWNIEPSAPWTGGLLAITLLFGIASLFQRIVAWLDPTSSSMLWMVVLLGLGLASLLYSLAGLSQTNLVQVLIGLTVTQAGLFAVGLLGGVPVRSALVVHLSATGLILMTLIAVSRLEGVEELSTESLQGLIKPRPFEALLIAVSLLGAAGFPLTLGFSGKLLVMESLARQEVFLPFLLAIALIVVGAIPSSRIVLQVLSCGPIPSTSGVQKDRCAEVVIIFALALTLWVGVLPETLLSWARRAAMGLF